MWRVQLRATFRASARRSAQRLSSWQQPLRRASSRVMTHYEMPLMLLFGGVVATTIVRSSAQRRPSDTARIDAVDDNAAASSSDDARAAGSLEDCYVVCEVLGQGHFATVRRGVDHPLPRAAQRSVPQLRQPRLLRPPESGL